VVAAAVPRRAPFDGGRLIIHVFQHRPSFQTGFIITFIDN
jgi:hypothetical protein